MATSELTAVSLDALPARDLDRRELQELVAAVAADPDAWAHHVGFGDDERVYVSLHRDVVRGRAAADRVGAAVIPGRPGVTAVRGALQPAQNARNDPEAHQPCEPGPPLNGPMTRPVIQPP